MITRTPLFRAQLMLGASAVALLGSASAQAQSNPFARRTDANAIAAQAAAAQARASSTTSAASQRALAAFAQAAKVRQQADQAQTAARAAAAAIASSVPNGLGTGGLQRAAGAEAGTLLWQGAKDAVQTTGSDGRTKVTIDQTQQQAILNWETFNVGRETDLTFNQQDSRWAVLNRVNDPAANPTQILGSIKAPGTVMVLNRNGVMFHGTSQVNVGALVAAAGNITDVQFLASGIYSPLGRDEFGGSRYLPVFDELVGDVKVLAGSRIETGIPASVTRGGGSVMLFGATIENAGSIATPRGQTLLAAGDNVLLRPGYSVDKNLYSTTYGNEVEPLIAADSTRGVVANRGIITAVRGDITLAGGTVTQAGVALSTSTVNTRGTIHLATPSGLTTGLVTLAPGSLTTILPELDSTETALDTQRDALIAASATANRDRFNAMDQQFTSLSRLDDRQDQSRIDIVSGGDVLFGGNSQAIAQGGQVTVSTKRRVQVDEGAWIDVSGVRDVALDATSNMLIVNVQGNELRDAPVNRDAMGKPLYNQNVIVDVRDLVYVPAGTDGYTADRYYTRGGLLEVGGYLANVGHTIGEWSAVGGTVSLLGKEIVAQRGATFNVAGGSLNYAGGMIRETLLQGADGRMYTAGNAPADLRMVSVGKSFQVLHPRWGEQYSEMFQSPFAQTTVSRVDPGYIVGRDGGRVILSAPTILMDATIESEAYQGLLQVDARPKSVSDAYKLTNGTAALGGGFRIDVLDRNNQSVPILPNIKVGAVAGSPRPVISLDDAITPDLLNAAEVAGTALNGLGSVFLRGSSAVIDTPVTLDDGGDFTVYADDITIGADIVTRGGHVFLAESRYLPALTGAAATIRVTQAVGIDTRGLWTNLLLDPLDRSRLAYRSGGSVSLIGKQITLEKDVWIDASSGGALTASGELMGAVGGDISLLSQGALILGGALRSHGVTRGGALSLRAKGFDVTGIVDPLIASGLLPAGTAAPADLYLTESFTVLAGTPLPLAISLANPTLIPPGQPITQYFASYEVLQNVADSVLSPGSYANSYDFETGISVEFYPGDTIPAGTQITYLELAPGALVPAGLFPDGIPVPPSSTDYVAGAIVDKDVTYNAGTLIPLGTSLAEGVAITGADVRLDASFFNSGFSSYTVNGVSSLTIAGDAQIAPDMALYERTSATADVRSGAEASSAMALVAQPLYFDDPNRALSTQRPGVDLAFHSGILPDRPGEAAGGSLIMETGASIAVDPGRKIQIASGGQVTIDGTLIAPGGTIAVENNRVVDFTVDMATSVWIGSNAVLDVSSRPHIAMDADGRRYGTVPDGGSITVGGRGIYRPDVTRYDSANAFLILRPGARLEASGASATIDLVSDTFSRTPVGAPVTVASDGGTITLNSYQGIYNDATMRAVAGGEGAAGGTLNVIAEGPVYGGVQMPWSPLPDPLKPGRTLVITDATVPTLLPADLEAGVANENLVIGRSNASAQQIRDGGFDTVTLWGRQAIYFDGDVNLTAGRQISLRQGDVVGNFDPDGRVTIAAPYVYIGGRSEYLNPPSYPGYPNILPDAALTHGASLTVEAELVDMSDLFSPNFASTVITSRSDIRFLTAAYAANGKVTGITASNALTLTADRIYPASNVQAEIKAGISLYQENFQTYERFADDSLIRIVGGDDGADRSAIPLSVFGGLAFRAAKIEQGGVVRAPHGSLSFNTSGADPDAQSIDFLAGSVTSASAEGLVMPYGGTTDGVTYTVNGTAAPAPLLGSGTANNLGGVPLGVSIAGFHVRSASGSIIDVSGGGTLLGAAFVQGRGGSVDTLLASRIGGEVYAILPGTDMAPAPGGASVAWTGAVPTPGQQVTIPEGVPGLAAGTYTLLPANYALMPGAFRVELGDGLTTMDAGVVRQRDGSFALTGYQSTAHTYIRDALPTSMLITPGSTIRTYSQYNEQGYDAFQIANAAVFGATRPLLPRDGKFLTLNLYMPYADDTESGASSLDIRGTTDFSAGENGYAGSLAITAIADTGGRQIRDPQPWKFVITRDDSAVVGGPGVLAIRASDIARFDAPALSLMTPRFYDPEPNGQRRSSLEIEDGVTLSASRIVLGAQYVDIGDDVTISTIGEGNIVPDSSDGTLFGSSDLASLVVANGDVDLFPTASASISSMTIGRNTRLYSEGTVAFGVARGVTFEGSPMIGAREVALAVPSINIGTVEALASAEAANILPDGVGLDQAFLESLFSGNPEAGIPAVERLTLQATQSVNFFGTVDLDTRDPATGLSRLDDFVLKTPALYGFGGTDDAVNLTAGRVILSGLAIDLPVNYGEPRNVVSATPGAIIPNGPGTGTGTFNINAEEIVFGEPGVREKSVVLDRLLLGFSNVNLNASRSVSAVNKNSLTYYAQPGATAGQPGTGGTLTIATPLLTGAAGSIMNYTVGEALTVRAPDGGAPAQTAGVTALGAEVSLKGQTVAIDTAVALPSGLLKIEAANDIRLGDAAYVDLGGRTIRYFDVARESWGGTLSLQSNGGDIVQTAGGIIDLAARDDAGTIKATALAGAVRLGGTLLGSGGEGKMQGSAEIRTLDLGDALDADFAALNASFDSGGFTQARSFTIGRGDLTVTAPVTARTVTIAIDDGSLTVDGLIDASGATPGTIRLSAEHDLRLTGNARLDAHGTTLRRDSNGEVIQAVNRGHVELAARTGTLRLDSGSAIDLSNPDGIARGRVELNAPRVSETGGDIRVEAAGGLSFAGVDSLALNAFWSYAPTDPLGTIVQDNGGSDPIGADGSVGLDQIHPRSQAFIDNALGNTALRGRIAGLAALGDAFHLRPGVDIHSATADGDLVVLRDLDLSGYRYGPDAAGGGAGEPMSLMIRAGGDLTVAGSITDGFERPEATPEDGSFIVIKAGPISQALTLFEDVTIQPGTLFAEGAVLGFDLPVMGTTLLLMGQVTDREYVLEFPERPGFGESFVFPGTYFGEYTYLETGSIFDPYSWRTYNPGDVIYQLYSGAVVAPGTSFRAANPSDAILPLTNGPSFAANRPIPVPMELGQSVTIPAAFTATARIVTPEMTFEAGDLVPAGTVLGLGTQLSTGASLPVEFKMADTLFPAGTPLDLIGGAKNASALALDAGSVIPGGSVISSTVFSQFERPQFAAGAMQAPGTMSASLRLVAGADLNGADSRAVRLPGALAGQGNITLSDPHVTSNDGFFNSGTSPFPVEIASVLRTGTGSIDLVAGGDVSQASLFGIYTAGTDMGNSVDGVYFPEHGGDVLVSAQGSVSGYQYRYYGAPATDEFKYWLTPLGDAFHGATGINFGRYVDLRVFTGFGEVQIASVYGFNGLGTLGGGNLSVIAGGDVGAQEKNFQLVAGLGFYVGTGLTLVVAGTQRVTDVVLDQNGQLASQTLQQNGGGDLTVKAGGTYNPGNNVAENNEPPLEPTIAALRGDIRIEAAALGRVEPLKGNIIPIDPRPDEPGRIPVAMQYSGPQLMLGDTRAVIRTRGDLSIGAYEGNGPLLSPFSDGVTAQGRLSYWTDRTSVDLVSLGGDLSPNAGIYTYLNQSNLQNASGSVAIILPAQWRMAAPGGSIYLMGYGGSIAGAGTTQLDMLAGNSIFSSSSIGFLPWQGPPRLNDFEPSNIYAVNGDVVNVRLGGREIYNGVASGAFGAGEATRVRAGRDIVGFGGQPGFNDFTYSPSLFLNHHDTDISVLEAGRDIIFTNLDIAGPGTLEITAGRNFYQGNQASITSVGTLAQNDDRRGADISVLAGATGLDWGAVADLYLDPANLIGTVQGQPLPLEGSGKVAKTYEAELTAWLIERYAYAAGSPEDAMAYFDALAPEQQRIFLRQVYFAELTAGGREYNDVNGPRLGSYLRGRNMIATLFPEQDGDGNAIARAGDVTMFGPSGIASNFGGDIQIMSPAGRTLIGIEGTVPPSTAGLVTLGTGDIQVYSEGSILLGLSRVLTTFGGDIVMWSAEGDINAGRGAKTTILLTPPKRVFDFLGNIELAPQAPSAGAGIATLDPIPEVPPGDVDLIAPLGTVDAGEAGIRVSGNINVAALHVVNAANIQVKGNASGLPVTATVNTGALAAASGAASAVSVEAERLAERARPRPVTEIPTILRVRFVGFGEQPE